MSGGTTYNWSLTTSGNGAVHSGATLSDSGAGTSKAWTFQATAGSAFLGLATRFEERDNTGRALARKDYTWSQDAAQVACIGEVLTTLDPGTADEKQSKNTQSMDPYGYGNVVQAKVYDYGNLTTPARTYDFVFLTDANYTSRYIWNRVTSASLTAGGVTTTLVTNTYDGYGPSNQMRNWGNPLWHDANYGATFIYRGNATTKWTAAAGSVTISYDIAGVVYKTVDAAGRSMDITTSANTGYSLPETLTPNGNNNLTTSVAYANSFAVTMVSGPNGATSTTGYDQYGRPQQSTIADGAVTTFSYTYNPTTQTATLGSGAGARWKKTTVDGFGRTSKVEMGHDAVTMSVAETEYAPCACSPLGKMWRTSRPHAPEASAVWTTYTYDGTGRTLTVTAADGSVTRYEYKGNTTKVTDPAGKWKLFTNDAMGNLVQVNEPNPAGGADYITNYNYDPMNHLTLVVMPRHGQTQTRTFVWNGADMVSATNPENGTVTYGYDSAHRVVLRTDAKGQKTHYDYDAYGRMTSVWHEVLVNGVYQQVPTETVNYYYDWNPFGYYSQYAWGRLAAVGFQREGSQTGEAFTYQYSYNQAGRVLKQRVTMGRQGEPGLDVEASYGWDNEGRMTSMGYPAGNPAWGDGPTPSVGYQFDAMGRPSGMTGSYYATAVYGAAGELTSFNGDTRTYNVLGQLTRIQAGTAMDVEYQYAPSSNNGRITGEKDWLTGEQVTYGYDSLNRLIAAAGSGSGTVSPWSQTYAYDGWGNPGSVPDVKNGKGSDANGVHLAYGTRCYPGGCYGPDVENRLLDASAAKDDGSWSYDGSGKRVMYWHNRITGPNSTDEDQCEIYFYGITGQRLTTYSCGYSGGDGGGFWWRVKGRSAYFVGKPVVLDGVAVVTDRLGSVRWRGGQAVRYYPYGEERTPTANGVEKFGTYVRDADGLDYADQRYYGVGTGRFLTPDPSTGVSPSDPGSWNKYAYVQGDPVNYVDPWGLLWCAPEHPCPPPGPGGGGGGSGSGGPGGSGNCQMYGILSFNMAPPCDVGGGGGPDPVPARSNRDFMPRALETAINALKTHPKCAELFGTAETRSGGFDPIDVIQQVYKEGGGSVAGQQVNTVFESMRFGNAKTVGLTVTIDSDEDSAWNSYDPSDSFPRAVPLLHELGHIYQDLNGSGGSKIKNDGGIFVFTGRGTLNDKSVIQDCFR